MRNNDTERIHFKESLEIPHQVSHDTCMQIQEKITQRPYSHDDMQRAKTLSVANRKEAETNVNNCHLEKT